MKFGIKDRIQIGVLFPKQGNLVEQTLVRDISKKMVLSQAEMKEIEFKAAEHGYRWNEKKAKDKEIELTEAELGFLKEQVVRIDGEKKIDSNILELCLKIKG